VRRLRRYLALTPAGRALVLRSLLLLPMVAVRLRTRGLARTTAWLERLRHPDEDDAETLAPEEIARLVHAAASLLRIRCLPRSLVQWHFLRHRNASAEVRMGVSKLADGSLAAHAWLELDGLPLNDPANIVKRYIVLPSRPRQTSG
jgi:hypothetical protein